MATEIKAVSVKGSFTVTYSNKQIHARSFLYLPFWAFLWISELWLKHYSLLIVDSLATFKMFSRCTFSRPVLAAMPEEMASRVILKRSIKNNLLGLIWWHLWMISVSSWWHETISDWRALPHLCISFQMMLPTVTDPDWTEIIASDCNALKRKIKEAAQLKFNSHHVLLFHYGDVVL